jgi:acyl-CoA thioester hydrolase
MDQEVSASPGRFHGREHSLAVRVYYEDTDFTGVVYHANYLRYFERGRSDFLRLAGIDHTALLGRANPCAFAVTRMTIEFLRPARIDETLTVFTAYDSFRGARLLIRQRIGRGPETIASADVEAVCIAPSGRPMRPPRDLVELLAPRLLVLAAP